MTDREIFLHAPIDQPKEVLEAYLSGACKGDSVLEKKVRRLIELDRSGTDFMEMAPLGNLSAPDRLNARGETTGTIIGHYKLLQKIGEGGFGVVFMAEQLRPVKRRVALKIIKLGMDTRQVVARFEVERQALAMMDHPNIAKVLDAGTTDEGRPFFVMELVKGVPITRFCEEHKLPTEARLRLFMDVCNAVQHAHQKGIIHRDLKPSNVLVTLHDDKAVPKVIDFGVAKALHTELTDLTLYTRFEQFIGTPAYMSPEQTQMSGLDIDTRSDIYTLGVLLYELLTGTTPFDARELKHAGQEEMKRIIREREPPKPSTRIRTIATESTDRTFRSNPSALRALRGDLDWIVMQALEKDRTRRYATANALTLDIQRHLDNEPVSAGAPGLSYRLSKFARKHRRAFATATGIAALLVVGLVVSSVLAVKWKRAEADATASKIVIAEEKETVKFRLAEEYFSGKGTIGLLYLVDLLRDDPHNRRAAERLASALVFRDYARPIGPLNTKPRGLRIAKSTSFVGHGDGLKLVGASPYVNAFFAWDAKSGNLLTPEPLFSYDPPKGVMTWDVDDGDFSPDKRYFAAADPYGESVAMWDLHTGEQVMLEKDVDTPEVVRFSPNPGRPLLLAAGHGGCTVFDYEKRERLNVRFTGHKGGWISGCDFSPDGLWVVSASEHAYIWDPATGEIKEGTGPLSHNAFIWSVDFSPAGNYIATGSGDNTAQLWSVESGKKHGDPLEHDGRVNHILFSPDGSILATASEDGTARLWDVSTGKLLVDPLPHDDNAWRLAFDPTGRRLATGARDGRSQVWDVGSGDPVGSPIKVGPVVTRLDVSHDGRTLMALGGGSGAGLWKVPEARPRSIVMRHPAANTEVRRMEVTQAQFLDSDRILTTCWAGQVTIWDAASGERIEIPKGTEYYDFAVGLDSAAEGALIAVASRHKGVRLLHTGDDGHWSVEQLVAAPSFFTHVEFSRSGSHLLASSLMSPTQIWRIRDGNAEPLDDGNRLGSMSSLGQAHFSPDPDCTVVVASADEQTIRAWRLEDRKIGETVGAFSHQAAITDVQFSPKGQFLATADTQGIIKVWALEDQGRAPEVTFELSGPARSVRFSPDGRFLAAASDDGSARIWEWKNKTATGIPLRHDLAIRMVIFSPDGTRVATASDDKTARIWDRATGLPLSEPLLHDGWVWSVAFNEDGTRLLTAAHDGTARIWDVPCVPEEAPVPGWFLEWVEAVAGKSLTKDGDIVPLSSPEVRTRISRAVSQENGYYARLARWFHSEAGPSRTVTPFSATTIRDCVNLELAAGDIRSLESAALIAPDNPIVRARLAYLLRNNAQVKNARSSRRADFYERQAAGELRGLLADNPDDLPAWRGLLGIISSKQEDFEQGAGAFQRALAAERDLDEWTLLDLDGIAGIFQRNDRKREALSMRMALLDRRRAQSPKDSLLEPRTRGAVNLAVELKDWDAAGQILGAFLEHDATSQASVTGDWMWLAAIYLHAGDLDAYNQLRRQMVEKFKDGQKANDLERPAKIYFAAPADRKSDASSDALEMACKSTDLATAHQAPWMALARGMAEFRMGEYDAALESLARTGEPAQQPGIFALPYRAMTAHFLGNTEQAQSWLEKARAEIGSLPATPIDKQHDAIFARLALREAEELLGGATETQ